MRRGFTALLIAAALAAVGCNTKGTVTGKVTYNGKPVTNGTVTAVGGDGIPLTGAIGIDGSYMIENVVSGQATFAVSSPNPDIAGRAAIAGPPGGGRKGGGGEGDITPPAQPGTAPAPKSGWVALPDQYSNPANSGLSAVVKGDTVVNLDLK